MLWLLHCTTLSLFLWGCMSFFLSFRWRTSSCRSSFVANALGFK